MELRQPSNQIRIYYTFLFIDLGYTQKIKQQKVDVIAEKEKV
jgi:hypothetical protein